MQFMYQFVKLFLEEKVWTNQTTDIFSQFTHVGILHSWILLTFFFLKEYILLMMNNYDDDADDVILLTFIFLKEQMLMRVMFNVENVDDEYDAGVILTLKTFELKLSGTELMRPLKENVY